MKQKYFIFALVAMLSCFVSSVSAALTVSAETTDTGESTVVAKIGDNSYATFDAAITAANALTGNVTVEIYGKVEYSSTTADLTGAYDNIAFVGKSTDAEISITRNGSGGYISGSTAGNDCTVSFTDLILSKPNGAWANDAGFMNVYFTVYRTGAVTYTNCTFPDGACAQGNTVTYTNCTFANQTSGEYSLWVYADCDVTVDGGRFTGVRGVKIYSEAAANVDKTDGKTAAQAAATGNLTLTGVTFTASVTEKPAVVLTYGESVTLDGNTYNNVYKKTNAATTFELDKDGAPNGTTVTVTENETAAVTCYNDNGVCGVLVGDKIYTTVADAAAVATAGSTVTLLHDSSETVTLPNGVTLDTNGYTAAGVTEAGPTEVATFEQLVAAIAAGGNITLTADITTTAAITTSGVTATIDLNGKTLTIGAGDNKFNDASNITIKNGNICITGVTVSGNAIFCLDEYEETLVTTLTLDNVNLTGNGYSSAYGIFYIGDSSVLNVNGGTWNLSNDTYAAGGVFKADAATATLNIDGTTMTLHNVRRVVTYANTTIENSTMTITGDADGVDAQMEHGFNRSPLAVTNSTITMENMVGRGITAECGAVTISENSTVTMTNCQEATIQVKGNQTVTVDNTSTVTVDAEPTITSGTISGTVTVKYVAKIGEQGYATLQKAIDACVAGDNTIVLVDNVTENVTITQQEGINVVIDGAQNTFTGVMTVFGNGRQSGAETLTIKNVVFQTVEGAESCIVSPDREVNNSYSYSHNVTVDGCTFKGIESNPYTAAAIRHQDGGDKSWVVTNCTVDANMHSLLQVNNVEGKLTVSNCTVNSKNGINLNQCTNVEITGNTISVKGYAVRTGATTGSETDNETVVLSNNTLATDNSEGDAVIVIRTTSANVGLTMSKNAVSGTTHISGVTDATTVSANANYWDGKAAPVVSGTAVNVTSYYSDAALTTLVTAGLSGEGTAESPYLINNIDELKWFRDNVNAGTTYKGLFVKLAASIDLNNEEWTPIGYLDETFEGTFDGGNNTISNLKITKTTENAAANNGIGLFGRTDSPAVIQNLTIENVDITGSLYVGAVVGLGYTGNKVENVTVKGDIAIDAWWYAGVIGGNGYMNLINNCHVIGNDGSYIKGNDGSYIGGIWGFRGEGANNITNCTVTNLNITGVDRVGGISGIGHYGNTVSDCTVEKVSVTATDADATTVGLIVGACQGKEGSPTTITDVAVKDNVIVTVGETVVENPALYGTNISGTAAVTNYVAHIGSVYYESLAAALEAVQANETITLLCNVTTAEQIALTKTITIDGNGHTLTYTGDSRAITVESTAEGVGLTLKNLTVDCTASYCQRGINYNTTGALTLENVTVKGTSVTYALNLPSSSDGATVKITDSSLTGCIALNVWGENATIDVTNSTLTSVDKSEAESYAALKLNNDATNAAEGTVVTVTGGTITALDENGEPSSAVSNSTNTGKVNISETTVVSGNINGAVALVKYEGYSECYSCFTLQSAINKAADDSKATVVLIKDVTLDAMVTVGGTVTLDLNGCTISTNFTATPSTGNDCALCVLYGGNLTIKGEGTIDGSGVYGAVKMTNKGDDAANGTATLTVNGGKLIGNYYAIVGNGGRHGTAITINGGTITANNADGLSTGVYHPQEGTLTVNGGTISAATGIEMRAGTLTVTDGTIESTADELSTNTSDSGTTVWGAAIALSQHTTNKAITVTVSGGTLSGPYAFYQDRLIKTYSPSTGISATIASGVTVTGEVAAGEAGFEIPQAEDGSYTLEQTMAIENEFNLVDGELTEYTNTENKLVKKITYTRTLLSGSKWNALYLPFEIPVEMLTADGKYEVAYFNAMHSYDNDNDGEIDALDMEIFKLTSGTLKANYPYFIKATDDAYVNLSIELEDATLYAAKETELTCSSVFNKYVLSGSYKTRTATDLADSYVIITDGTWGYLSDTGSLKPFRLYLTITDIDGSPVKVSEAAVNSIRIVTRGEEEGTTAVEEVPAADGAQNVIYDLRGNRVETPAKGIYIVNGKKVIFK